MDPRILARHEQICSDLDTVLKYHVEQVLTYEKRNDINELHARYEGDPVFELFGMTDMSFTRRRFVAGFANSCATNLGRFTDKATKIILVEAFGLPKEQILKKVQIAANNKIEIEETDGVILSTEVGPELAGRVQMVADDLSKRLCRPFQATGVGFELRGRYGKNDDTLIQKDEHMSEAIRSLGAVPVMGTFSTANAVGAITRLCRSWVVLTGRETVDVIARLTGFDLIAYLESRSAILRPVTELIKL